MSKCVSPLTPGTGRARDPRHHAWKGDSSLNVPRLDRLARAPGRLLPYGLWLGGGRQREWPELTTRQAVTTTCGGTSDSPLWNTRLRLLDAGRRWLTLSGSARQRRDARRDPRSGWLPDHEAPTRLRRHSRRSSGCPRGHADQPVIVTAALARTVPEVSSERGISTHDRLDSSRLTHPRRLTGSRQGLQHDAIERGGATGAPRRRRPAKPQGVIRSGPNLFAAPKKDAKIESRDTVRGRGPSCKGHPTGCGRRPMDVAHAERALRVVREILAAAVRRLRASSATCCCLRQWT